MHLVEGIDPDEISDGQNLVRRQRQVISRWGESSEKEARWETPHTMRHHSSGTPASSMPA